MKAVSSLAATAVHWHTPHVPLSPTVAVHLQTVLGENLLPSMKGMQNANSSQPWKCHTWLGYVKLGRCLLTLLTPDLQTGQNKQLNSVVKIAALLLFLICIDFLTIIIENDIFDL